MPHVRSMTRAAIALSLASLAGCASWPGADHSRDFVIVRHAEKVPDGSDDPELTAAGRARAQAIADTLADTDVVAVYSTDTRRTRQTATPTAQAHGLPIIPYAGEEPAQALATRLLDAHSSGTVLVVGHSNTAPGIAAALCGCEVEPMDESEYDRRMTIHIDGDGDVTLLTAPIPMP
ncbi:histidine phosphatase family protein [Lysobacter sp. F60174L2]|uniref:histidine phosphatase family protein n=1 Tax=Lysobacter sp. F60174L2 TaxID=3459295 RepID=UPI00403D7802